MICICPGAAVFGVTVCLASARWIPNFCVCSCPRAAVRGRRRACCVSVAAGHLEKIPQLYWTGRRPPSPARVLRGGGARPSAAGGAVGWWCGVWRPEDPARWAGAARPGTAGRTTASTRRRRFAIGAGLGGRGEWGAVHFISQHSVC